MERDWTISELDEMFSDELEYLYPPDNPALEEDEQETEEKENFKQINYLLDSEVIFTQEQLEEELSIRFTNNQLRTFKLFMLNMFVYDKAIGFSYGNNPHPVKEWNPHEITYSTVQGVINRLNLAGLVKFVKGEASKIKKNRKASTVIAKPKFQKWIDRQFYPDEIFTNCNTHVRLRMARDKREIVPYEPTTYTKHIDSIMKRYHKKLDEWDIRIDGIQIPNIHLFVNFQAVKDQVDSKGNYLIRHGGRWFGEWNSIKSDERLKRISFEGAGELTEIDYKACGSNALQLWETGRWIKEDPYIFVGSWLAQHFDIEGKGIPEMRKFIKTVIHIAINVSRKGLRDAWFKGHHKKKQAEMYADMSDRVAEGYRFYNRDIAHWICAGELSGRKAMFIESNLMLGVLDRLVKADIPVVTIYDSFIIPKKKLKQAHEIIHDSDNLKWLKKLLAKDEQGTL